MSAQEEFHIMLLEQMDECVRLFERHIRSVTLRCVALEQVRVGAYNDVPERLCVSPAECLFEPICLSLTKNALAGVEEDIQIAFAERCAHDGVIGRPFPQAQVN